MELFAKVLLFLGAVLVAAATLVLLSAHLATRYQMDHSSGTWIAYALEARQGTLYPPLFDGQSFGGTRYMPLSISLAAGAMSVIRDPLVAAKTLSVVTFIALLLVTAMVLRRFGLPRLHVAGLVLLLPVTDIGLQSALGIRYDAIPAALQLTALGLLTFRATPKVTAAAAFCCALALLAKLTAIWAALAIAISLWRRERRTLLRFLVLYAAITAALFAVFSVASDGRLVENLGTLSGAGVDGAAGRLLRAPLRATRDLVHHGQAVWAVSAFALLGLAVAIARRCVTVFHVGAVIAAGIAALSYVDVGVQANHLLDLLVLTIVLSGQALVSLGAGAGGRQWLLPTVATLLSTILVTSWVAGPARDLEETVTVMTRHALPGQWKPKPLSELIGPSTSIFSEDPYLSIAHGKKPVVRDAFILLRLLRDNPSWKARLVNRIERQEFDLVALTSDPHTAPEFYMTSNLGPDVLSAIERAYLFKGVVDNYWVYIPRHPARQGPT